MQETRFIFSHVSAAVKIDSHSQIPVEEDLENRDLEHMRTVEHDS